LLTTEVKYIQQVTDTIFDGEICDRLAFHVQSSLSMSNELLTILE